MTDFTKTGFDIWFLQDSYSLAMEDFRLDYSPREATFDVTYSVALDGEDILVGISRDSRFGYELDDFASRRDGAGIVTLLKIVEDTDPVIGTGTEPVFRIVSYGEFYAASDLRAGDALGWRLSDIVNGQVVVSRPASEPTPGVGTDNVGDVLLYNMPY